MPHSVKRTASLAATFAVGLLCLPILPAAAESGTGARIYSAHCAICHGPSGRGDGDYAMFLKVAPADLTQLSAENDGAFPFEDVYRVIDGRTDLAAHGPREMPIWGYEFSRLAVREGEWINPEVWAAGRIFLLIQHIRTLQAD